ncbi:hypothetical protein TNCV_3219471 [Trichonephila clavipes]|nr:hypothetical protein TNCV_3219471 [Trichonephila clavipes]
MMQHEQKNEESEFKFCKTFNCIYMLTCGVCGFKYIGQTSGAMNLRINQHRSDIGKNTPTKNIGRIEIQHFNKHGFEDVALNIIKIVPNKINRLWYENVYTGIYNAMYPYGLNVIWNNKNLIQAVKQNDKESIYNSRNNSNKRKRVEELFPVLGEFVGVVGGQQLVFLERPKRALLDSCLENKLAIPFLRFLPRKENPPPG